MEQHIQQQVQDYYGTQLQTSQDLLTNACCTDDIPLAHRRILAQLESEVLEKYYGCGVCIPDAIEGITVLDLGSGSGRDAYLLSKLVGENGHVIGVDMTEEQLDVARRHIDAHTVTFGYAKPNVEFRHGYIEDLQSAGIEDNSVDLVVSNCVLNLSTDKEATYREIFRVLKPGGEMFIADVFSDRRMPETLRQDPMLYGECLSGALYTEDFRRLLLELGMNDYRLTAAAASPSNNEEIRGQSRQHRLLFADGARLQARHRRPVRRPRPGGHLPGHHSRPASPLRARRPPHFRNRPPHAGVRQHRRHGGRYPLRRPFPRRWQQGPAFWSVPLRPRASHGHRCRKHRQLLLSWPRPAIYCCCAPNFSLPETMIKSLKSTGNQLADSAFQLTVLGQEVADTLHLPRFHEKLRGLGLFPLRPVAPAVLQINVGKMCNQVCKHCHVDAGPDRKEIMTRETMQHCLDALAQTDIPTVDLTGGAPEMNPDFRWFVEEIASWAARCWCAAT